MVDEFRPKRVGLVTEAEERGLEVGCKSTLEYWARIFGAGIEKAARRSVPPKTKKPHAS
jgi:hypothetical protein